MDEKMKQDINEQEQPSPVCPIQLLFKEKPVFPDKEEALRVLRRHFGNVECVDYKEDTALFAAMDYRCDLKDRKNVPVLLTFMAGKGFEDIDSLTLSQMFWSCHDCEKVISECNFTITAIDMIGLPDYKKRAKLIIDYAMALAELFPEADAVYFQRSGKLFHREELLRDDIPEEDRYLYYAVNIRYFNVEGTDDHVVDSIGMGPLYLPDVQYHFRGIDANAVINHAYSLLSYVFGSGETINDEDTIDGIRDGEMSSEVQWKCGFADSLIVPPRPVINVEAGEFYAGSEL